MIYLYINKFLKRMTEYIPIFIYFFYYLIEDDDIPILTREEGRTDLGSIF